MRVPKKLAWRDLRVPCRNKDLRARNKVLLYPRGEIPRSDFVMKLESFAENRVRVFNEIEPIEKRLNIPGRIIHLVHAHSGKYLPYYESFTSLREIDLSLDVIVSKLRTACLRSR